MVIILLFAFLLIPAKGQIFPLKISNNGRNFVTKKGIPFLLNACAIELNPLSLSEIEIYVNRLQTQGCNAIYIPFNFNEIVIDNKNAPDKATSKKITSLKRIIRETALKELAVIISIIYPDSADSKISIDDPKYLFLGHFIQRFKYKNVLWVFNREVLNEYRIQNIKPRQLTGTFFKSMNSSGFSSSSFNVISDIDQLQFSKSKPSLLFIQTDKTVSDSLTFAIRNLAFHGMLTGISGIVFDQITDSKIQKIKPYSLIQFHLKKLKATFDTMQWYNFKPIPEITCGEETVTSVITGDSSQVVIYYPFKSNLSLDLEIFKSKKLRFTWIDPTNGSVQKSEINPYPAKQLFMPPFSDQKYADWLLIIGPKEK